FEGGRQRLGQRPRFTGFQQFVTDHVFFAVGLLPYGFDGAGRNRLSLRLSIRRLRFAGCDRPVATRTGAAGVRGPAPTATGDEQAEQDRGEEETRDGRVQDLRSGAHMWVVGRSAEIREGNLD